LNILALETSSQHCSVALQAGKQLYSREDNSALSHSRSLLSLIDQVLKDADLALSDLNAIAVARGPGSFTGLRIGIAVAQGLAFGQQLPIVPVSSLALVAANTADFCRDKSIAAERVLATMDARMGEIYCAWYDIQNEIPVLLGSESVLPPEALDDFSQAIFNSQASDDVINSHVNQIVGGGLQYQQQFSADLNAKLNLSANTDIAAALNILPDAKAMLAIASQAFDLGQGIEPEALTPVYLRNNVTY
jgi:tRNA threonylcarbamoyladenosine biosynthesis protein TsaB